MSPRLITYSSTISCSIAVGTSWSRVDTGGFSFGRKKYFMLQLNAIICVSKQSLFAVEQTMEDKEAIVFDDAFIRKAFKGLISVDELLLYLCKSVVRKLTLFIRLRHGRQWRDLLARVQSCHEEVRTISRLSQSIFDFILIIINKKR